jgi:hypothetical protein
LLATSEVGAWSPDFTRSSLGSVINEDVFFSSNRWPTTLFIRRLLPSWLPGERHTSPDTTTAPHTSGMGPTELPPTKSSLILSLVLLLDQIHPQISAPPCRSFSAGPLHGRRFSTPAYAPISVELAVKLHATGASVKRRSGGRSCFMRRRRCFLGQAELLPPAGDSASYSGRSCFLRRAELLPPVAGAASFERAELLPPAGGAASCSGRRYFLW